LSRIAGRFRFRHLWLTVPFWGLAVRASLPLSDNSFLWHVRAGVDQLASGEVIRTDPYSFTRFGEPWRTQSWLIELAYGRLERWFPGLSWAPWFLFAVMAIALLIVLALLWSRLGLRVGLIACLVAVGIVMQAYAHPRPAMVSFVFFGIVAALIATHRPPLWAIPPLMWLWAAVHGAFIVGLGVLFLDAIRRRSRRQAIAGAVGMLAATLTAHGAGIWTMLFAFATNRGALAFIQEWQPPDFTNLWLVPFLVLLTLLLVGMAAGHISVRALWVVAPVIVFALLSTRNVLPATLLLTPWLADASSVFPTFPEKATNPVVVWGAALVFATSAIWLAGRPVSLETRVFPSDEVVAAVGDGRLFTTMAPGGYLIYLGRDPVFIDDRAELYGAEFYADYERAVQGAGWSELFEEYEISEALLPNRAGLLGDLEESGWQVCAADDSHELVSVACR
jgi:hypothetical protein